MSDASSPQDRPASRKSQAHKISQLVRACRVANRAAPHRKHRHASRLWDWCDNQMEADDLWYIMLIACPWAFSEAGQVNSIIRP